MEISKKGLLELKDLLSCYENQVFDLKAMEKVLDLMNQEEIIRGFVNYSFDSKYDACTDMNTGKLYFNEDLFLKNASSMYDKFIPDELKIEATNLNMISVFIHECTHLEQYLYLTKKIKCKEEISKLYGNLYQKSNELRFKFMYHFFSLKFSFERNANLAGFYNTELLASQDLKKFFQTYFIYSLLEGYEIKNGKKTNPVDITYKIIGIKDKINIYSLTQKERFLHGTRLLNYEYDDIIKPYDGYNLRDIEYEPLVRKIMK